jgi:flagellar motor switch protein FliN/FliY
VAIPALTPDDLPPPDTGSGLGMQLRDIPLSVGVRVGRAKLSMQTICDFRAGQLIELDRDVGSPVDVVANGVVIAHGENVEINEEYGVRILELVVDRPRRSIFAL